MNTTVSEDIDLGGTLEIGDSGKPTAWSRLLLNSSTAALPDGKYEIYLGLLPVSEEAKATPVKDYEALYNCSIRYLHMLGIVDAATAIQDDLRNTEMTSAPQPVVKESPATQGADRDMQLLSSRLIAEKLAKAVNDCIEENGHLADGDDCTLKGLKDALAEYSASIGKDKN